MKQFLSQKTVAYKYLKYHTINVCYMHHMCLRIYSPNIQNFLKKKQKNFGCEQIEKNIENIHDLSPFMKLCVKFNIHFA